MFPNLSLNLLINPRKTETSPKNIHITESFLIEFLVNDVVIKAKFKISQFLTQYNETLFGSFIICLKKVTLLLIATLVLIWR